ncbi:MAG: SUMF1/EgtB/PvdO family nonheme iron enzyme [Blastocatellales bacterium]
MNWLSTRPQIEVIENGAERGMHEVKKCNSCGNTYPENLSFCLNDGSPLVLIETMIGTVLDGRYRLDKLIGEGGMGEVYRATHIHIDTQFAVKLLRPEFVANQTAIKRFQLEAKAAGRIHHPNAVRVTDFGVTPERIVYLVMELAQGKSLRSLVRNEKKLDYLRAINIVRQICGAVDAAHRSGVIHRDLKPDNILIEKVQNAERVKVLDFGIAKLRETKTEGFLTQAGTIIGTPQYMSPEQCQSKPLDPSSDIYSIGVLLYEMLTGDVPFDGESFIQVVYEQVNTPPRPLWEISPEVPLAVAQVVMRALEKEPQQRQSSAIQLSDELKAAVEAVGEGGSLSMTSPFGISPLKSAEIRTPIEELPTLEEEQGDALPSLTDERPPSFDRETSVLPRRGTETDGPPTKGELKRSTSPDQEAPAVQKPAALELEIKAAAPRSKSKTPLIAIAAIALVAMAGTIAYFSLRPSGNVPEPPPATTPEGMILIPGGKFMMGRNDGAADEGPAHEVEIKPFLLDAQEVTNRDYKKFVDAANRPAPKHWKDGSYVPDEARYPVTHVTWEDATAYAKWANKRLPTEAEWEYAARGGDKGYLYPWGNEWQIGYANVDRKGQAKPAPVRSFEKDVSPFGIYDMAGNVSEWVQDFYSERYGANPDQRLRVYRGGNFLDAPETSMNTYRWSDFPVEIPDNQILRVGFRCAKDLEQR